MIEMKNITFVCLCCTNNNLDAIPHKLLPTSTDHVKMSPQVSGRYEGCFANSLVVIRSLQTNLEDGSVVSTEDTFKQFLSKIHIKVLGEWLWYLVSDLQQSYVIGRLLARWKIFINGFLMSSIIIKHDNERPPVEIMTLQKLTVLRYHIYRVSLFTSDLSPTHFQFVST